MSMAGRIVEIGKDFPRRLYILMEINQLQVK